MVAERLGQRGMRPLSVVLGAERSDHDPRRRRRLGRLVELATHLQERADMSVAEGGEHPLRGLVARPASEMDHDEGPSGVAGLPVDLPLPGRQQQAAEPASPHRRSDPRQRVRRRHAVRVLVHRQRQVADERSACVEQQHVVRRVPVRGRQVAANLVGGRPREPHLGEVDLVDQFGEQRSILDGRDA
jgi:hypothetical protein